MASIKQRPNGTWRARYRDEMRHSIHDTPHEVRRSAVTRRGHLASGHRHVRRSEGRCDLARLVLRRLVATTGVGADDHRRDEAHGRESARSAR